MKKTIIEKVLRKINFKIIVPILAPIRRRKLLDNNFTIISNNCWGGIVYNYFRIIKKSPTIGGYFYADDYIKFLKNIRYYTSIDMKIIKTCESKHFSDLQRKNESSVLVGQLDDIEFICLHYDDPEEAIKKWKRRCERINWDNLIVKFSYMNNCNDSLIYEFDSLEFENKFVFVSKDFEKCKSAIKTCDDGDQILDDTFYFKKNINLYEIINKNIGKKNE